MERKLIIFVVFATVAQSFFGRSSAILSKSDLAGLEKISNYQDTTVSDNYGGFELIFDELVKRVALLIANTTAPSDDSAQSASGLALVEDAIDLSLSAISLAVGSPDPEAVENARNAAYLAAEDGFSVANKALGLAQSSYGSDNTIEIEEYRSQVHDLFSKVIFSVYDALRSSLNSSSTDILDVLQAAEDGSVHATIELADAVFNAIRFYADAVAHGTADYSVLEYIESSRLSAKIALQTDATYKFSLLKALYIYLNQNGTKVSLPDLVLIQHAQTTATYKFVEITELIYRRIFTELAAIISGFGAVAQDDLTSKDIEEATAVAKWDVAAYEILLATVPNNFSAVETANEQSYVLTKEAMHLYFSQIETTRTGASDLSVTMAEIGRIKAGLYDIGAKYVDAFIALYLDQFDMTHHTKELITSFLSLARDQFENAADSVSNANALLAKTASGIRTVDLIANISAERDRMLRAARITADILSSAKLLILTSGN